MRVLSLLAATGLAMGAAGCEVRTSHSAHASATRDDLRTIARLECPERADTLRRVSAAADGRSCLYRGENGEVELRLTNLEGRTPDQILTVLEGELKPLLPDVEVANGAPEAPEPPEPSEPPEMAGDEEETAVRLPGFSVDTKGDRARVRMPGLTVDAEGDHADVSIGGPGGDVRVKADDGGAEIRVEDDGRHGLRRTFILAQDDPGPQGWRSVGYDARGPERGPLAVAVIKAKNDDDAFDAAKSLLRRNVGG